MDIICRWRDAITDPPMDGWHGVYRYNDGETICMSHGLHHGGSWWTELEYQDSRTPEPGDQWLDITDVPAVAVAKVQAAVDEINMEMKGPEDEWPIRILNYHTGLLPTECE